jgi:hypothetical protein
VSHLSCIDPINPWDNPDEGRNKINNSFNCIFSAITELESVSATGSTSVSSGANVSVSMTILSGVPDYQVSVVNNPVFTSVSATSISATTFYSGNTNLNDLFTGISASVTYTNTGATPTTIGGISAGSTFSGKTMQEMWDSLLYPYQSPAFSSFSLGISSPRQIGYDIGTSQTFTWGTSNASNVSANTITIAGYNLTTLTGLANDGSEPVTFTGVVTRSAADGPGTRAWTIQGTNTNNVAFSTSLSIRWDWIMYAGSSLNTSLTEAQIEALTVYNSVKNGFAGTYTFPFASPSEYRYFCFATTYGTPSTFIDTSTSFPVPMYLGYSNIDGNGNSYDLVSVTNSEGETTNYRVYRTLNAIGGPVTIQVS